LQMVGCGKWNLGESGKQCLSVVTTQSKNGAHRNVAGRSVRSDTGYVSRAAAWLWCHHFWVWNPCKSVGSTQLVVTNVFLTGEKYSRTYFRKGHQAQTCFKINSKEEEYGVSVTRVESIVETTYSPFSSMLWKQTKKWLVGKAPAPVPVRVGVQAGNCHGASDRYLFILLKKVQSIWTRQMMLSSQFKTWYKGGSKFGSVHLAGDTQFICDIYFTEDNF
jgi:hypothetical protein